MSKMEIMAELPKLGTEDHREIFERIGELEEMICSTAASRLPKKELCSTASWRSIAKIPKPVRLGTKSRRASANHPVRELAATKRK
jgi:hypothetical protein